MDRNLPSVLTHCGCILLAGGGSKRLGRPKQLLRFEGQTLIRRAACLALEAGYSPVVAVLGSHAEQIAPELEDLEAQVALNADWQAGMSSSLAAGLARVVSMDPDVSHTLVMVCDQIHVTAETLRELRYRSAFKPSNIVASKYAGVVGVPAIFPKDFFPLPAYPEW